MKREEIPLHMTFGDDRLYPLIDFEPRKMTIAYDDGTGDNQFYTIYYVSVEDSAGKRYEKDKIYSLIREFIDYVVQHPELQFHVMVDEIKSEKYNDKDVEYFFSGSRGLQNIDLEGRRDW